MAATGHKIYIYKAISTDAISDLYFWCLRRDRFGSDLPNSRKNIPFQLSRNQKCSKEKVFFQKNSKKQGGFPGDGGGAGSSRESADLYWEIAKKNVTILSIFWRCFRTPLPIPLQNLHFQHFEDRFRAFGRIKSIRTGQKGPVNTISSRQTFRKQHKSFF